MTDSAAARSIDGSSEVSSIRNSAEYIPCDLELINSENSDWKIVVSLDQDVTTLGSDIEDLKQLENAGYARVEIEDNKIKLTPFPNCQRQGFPDPIKEIFARHYPLYQMKKRAFERITKQLISQYGTLAANVKKRVNTSLNQTPGLPLDGLNEALSVPDALISIKIPLPLTSEYKPVLEKLESIGLKRLPPTLTHIHFLKRRGAAMQLNPEAKKLLSAISFSYTIDTKQTK